MRVSISSLMLWKKQKKKRRIDMPFYDFKCDKCGAEMKDFMMGICEENPHCPNLSCEGKEMRKLVSTGSTFIPCPGMYRAS